MPSVPGLTGRLYVTRWSEWQSRHTETCSTRYLPRARRAGVASTFSVDAGRCAGFFSESHDTAPAINATTATMAMPNTLRKVFIPLGLLFERLWAELYYPAARLRAGKNVNAPGSVMRVEPQTTSTSTTPGACAGTTTLRPLLTAVTAVPTLPPKTTLQRASSPWPTTVTGVPAGALAGSMRATAAPSATTTSTLNVKPACVVIAMNATPFATACTVSVAEPPAGIVSDSGTVAISGRVLQRLTDCAVPRAGSRATSTVPSPPGRSASADGRATIVTASTTVIIAGGEVMPGICAVMRERPACSAWAENVALLSPAAIVTEGGTSTSPGDDDCRGIVSGDACVWPLSIFSETRVPVA